MENLILFAMSKKILVLMASFPKFALFEVIDWLLEGKPFMGMPAVVSFLKEAHKLGYEVHVSIPVLDRNIRCKSFVHKDHMIVHPYPLPLLFLPLIRLLQIKGSVVLRILYPLLTVFFSFGFHKRLVNELHPHFIYQMGYSIVLGHFLHKSSGYPLIYRLFGTLEIWQNTKQLAKDLNLWQRYISLTEIFIYHNPGNMIVMSNDGTRGDRVMEKYGVPREKRLFLLNGVDNQKRESLCSIRKRFPKGTFMIAAMGRLVQSKGIARILFALPEILKYISKTKLIIIGDGRLRKSLERLAEALKVSNHVYFLGYIPHDKVISTLKQFDLYVSAQNLSNLSNCTLEAILAGLPIISLADGSLDALLKNGENAILLDPQNFEKELPQAIKNISEDKFLYRHLKEGVKEARKKIWSWRERIAFELTTIEKKLSNNT